MKIEQCSVCGEECPSTFIGADGRCPDCLEPKESTIVFKYLAVKVKEKDEEDFINELDHLLNEWTVDKKSIYYNWRSE